MTRCDAPWWGVRDLDWNLVLPQHAPGILNDAEHKM